MTSGTAQVARRWCLVATSAGIASAMLLACTASVGGSGAAGGRPREGGAGSGSGGWAGSAGGGSVPPATVAGHDSGGAGAAGATADSGSGGASHETTGRGESGSGGMVGGSGGSAGGAGGGEGGQTPTLGTAGNSSRPNSTGGTGAGGLAAGGAGPGSGGLSGGYLVSVLQSTRSQATDITQEEIRTLVTDAVAQAGGLGFLRPGQTVVVKPNLLVSTSDGRSTLLPVTTNGVTTDWRVTKAVTELVRERIGQSGKILIMEGSTESTSQAFTRLGYTRTNFGTDVDEYIPLEGSSCSDRTTGGLVQKTAANGKQYWVNQRYAEADAVISVAALKTHFQAGITGGVKNLGIGATPASQYSTRDCTRLSQIAHSPVEPLSAFIADYYSVRPADFVVMDGLQGIQHGPLPAWGGGDYNSDRMNMRLILASRNAVALDTVEASIMNCNPKKIPHLTKLAEAGHGTTDLAAITVVGKSIAEVRKTFAGPSFACPGN